MIAIATMSSTRVKANERRFMAWEYLSKQGRKSHSDLVIAADISLPPVHVVGRSRWRGEQLNPKFLRRLG